MRLSVLLMIALGMGACQYRSECHVTDPSCSLVALLLAYTAPPYPSVSIGNDSHTVMLFTDGTVRAWGGGSNGRLGNGGSTNTADGTGPSIIDTGNIQVGASVVQIWAGHQTTCALLTGGAMRCWGFGGDGRLGTNSTANIGDGVGTSVANAQNTPVGELVTQVAAGPHFSCALLITGAVRCWGGAPNGETGYNTTVTSGDGGGPTIIQRGDISLGGTAVRIATGGDSACAILTTGAVRCWGSGANGKLGYGSTQSVGNGVGPSIVGAGDVPLGGIATQISVGTDHACALLSTGTVRCWGSGTGGALGHGSTQNIGDGVGPSIITAGDVPVGSQVLQISAGQNNTCAVLPNGYVKCWGLGTSGRLGNNAVTNIGDGIGPSVADAQVVDVGGRVVQIETKAGATCAVLDSYRPRLRCWGGGGTGALGHNSTANIADGTGLSIIAAGDVPVGR
jgi:alpha-tubulin suppressor-like RCC1 family protein